MPSDTSVLDTPPSRLISRPNCLQIPASGTELGTSVSQQFTPEDRSRAAKVVLLKCSRGLLPLGTDAGSLSHQSDICLVE